MPNFNLHIFNLQDLLDGLIEQQKMLISKLEKGKGTMKVEEKTKIMKLLKELTNSIDRTRQDIKTSLAVQGSKSKADVGSFQIQPIVTVLF